MIIEEIKEVQDNNIEHWITDQRTGLHCSDCYEESFIKLLNNPNLPRILCIKCLVKILSLKLKPSKARSHNSRFKKDGNP